MEARDSLRETIKSGIESKFYRIGIEQQCLVCSNKNNLYNIESCEGDDLICKDCLNKMGVEH